MSCNEENNNPGQGLYVGDQGSLPLETRRVLVQLLAGPSVDAARHSKLWSILIRDEKLIRCYLAELFLDLVLDQDLQVGFIRQADTHDLEAPVLLRRAQLTFIDSALLLFLRQRLTQADTQGMRAVVSIEEMTENLQPYERSLSTDRAGFSKRVYASIEKLKKYNILQKIRASEERLEISPALKLLFSAEEILSLTHLYQTISSAQLPENAEDIA